MSVRSDFAVMILTSARPDKQYSYELLRKCGYTGKVFFIVGDDDKTRFELMRRYGKDKVIVFNKDKMDVDLMDNSGEKKSPTYAEKFMYEYAKEHGYTYFARMDDDIKEFRYKVEDGDRLTTDRVRDLDQVFNIMIDFMEEADMAFFGPSRAGFYFGGKNNEAFKEGVDLLISQLIMCTTKHVIPFRGKTYSDLVALLDTSICGRPAFRTMYLAVRSPDEGSNTGGVKSTYDKDPERYASNFFAVMAHPSGVKIRKRPGGDFGHTIVKENLFPKIISGSYKNA